MEEFARKTELGEYQSILGRNQLMSKCVEGWKMKSEPLMKSYLVEPKPLAEILWETESNCHTDSIRKRWIDQYQKIRCAKHPKDTMSCKVKKIDLCDFSEVQRMPSILKNMFISERECRVLPKLLPTLSSEEKKALMAAAQEKGCALPHKEL